MIARSTGWPMPATEAYAAMPSTVTARGLTGYTEPVKPPSSRFRRTSWPTPPAARPAPTTATDRGANDDDRECSSASPLALVYRRDAGRVWCRCKVHVDHAGAEGPVVLQAGVPEHVKHRPVMGERLADEPHDAVPASR